jgi:2,5-diamino-6-(ribosylamino)-4(3H)-pyrimidinone 5'-phosphate reductase
MASRPRVWANFASSVDGKINPAPRLRPRLFSMSRHGEDPRRMGELRARADAVLIGAGNLRADDPDLALAPAERARRRAAGEREPYRIVVTSRGEGIVASMRMFDTDLGGPSIVVHGPEMSEAARARLAGRARLIELGAGSADLPRLLHWVHAELGVETLLCEGGGILIAELFLARAVDELYLTLVPRVLGGVDAPTLAAGPGFLPDAIPDARLGSVERVGDELYLRYDFDWT